MPSAKDGVVVGWIGSSATLPYLEAEAATLVAVAARGQRVRLRVVADRAPTLPPGMALEYVPWSAAGEARAVAGMHLGFAPLRDDAWTRGKCGFKVVQLLGAGRPVVASPVGVQADQVRPDVTGFLGSTSTELAQGLMRAGRGRGPARAHGGCGARGRAGALVASGLGPAPARAPGRVARVTSLPAPRHLVVRLPNPLGDAVMATPALRALRAALPLARITWAGGASAQQALEGLPWRDDVFSLSGTLVKGARAPWRAARQLRRLGADAILLLTNSFSSALAARLAGIPTRVGTALDRRGVLLTHKLGAPLDARGRLAPRSMRAHYLDLVAPFGARDDGRGTQVVVTPFDAERAARRLAAVPQGTRLVGVSPGAAFGPSKIYPPALLGEALARLRAETGALPLVLCGPGEEALAREVAAHAGEPLLHTADDPPDLGELKGLLARCAVLLATDAGPRHLAEALGIPTVTWVGPTDPLWGSGGAGAVLRVEGLDCLACHKPICPIDDHPCMQRLAPERIVAAARGALAPAPPAP